MASPTQEELRKFGTPIEPFERSRNKRKDTHLFSYHTIKHDFIEMIHDARDDGTPSYPPDLQTVSEFEFNEIREGRNDHKKKECCYLWIIDYEGIKILWEGTTNFHDTGEKRVTHTNITGGAKALHGGELFFCGNRIFVNNKSDRYGHCTDEQWAAVIGYFQKTYSAYVILDRR